MIDPRDPVYAYRCPFCLADVGKACRSWGVVRRTCQPHAARRNAVRTVAGTSHDAGVLLTAPCPDCTNGLRDGEVCGTCHGDAKVDAAYARERRDARR